MDEEGEAWRRAVGATCQNKEESIGYEAVLQREVQQQRLRSDTAMLII